MVKRSSAALLAALLSIGCTKAAPVQEPRDTALPVPTEGSRDASPTTVDGIDPRAVNPIREAFGAYRAWGRVDDEMRWAPFKCLTPMPARPERSAAMDGHHARKLYSLFAKDRAAYVRLAADLPDGAAPRRVPNGQTIVKESFIAVREAEDAGAPAARLQALQARAVTDDHFDRYVREGDALYRAGDLAAVFVIVDVRGGSSGVPDAATDDGWIYGTLTPTGEVTSAGRVASCMECHARAPHDHLFGPKTDHRPYGLAR